MAVAIAAAWICLPSAVAAGATLVQPLATSTAGAVASWVVSGAVSGEPLTLTLPVAAARYGQVGYLVAPDGPWLRLGTSLATTTGSWAARAESYFGSGTYGILPWLAAAAVAPLRGPWVSADGNLSLSLDSVQVAAVEVMGIPELPLPWLPRGPAYRVELSSHARSLSLRPTDPTSGVATAVLVLTPTGEWVELPSRLGPDGWRAMAKVGTATVVIAEHPARAQGTASWYRFRGCDCAASRAYPKGTLLEVTRADLPDRRVTVRVNDYGPEAWTGRVIDLDAVAFKKLGSTRLGLLTVTVKSVKLPANGQVQ